MGQSPFHQIFSLFGRNEFDRKTDEELMDILVENYQSNEQVAHRAFSALVKRHTDKFYRLAWRLLTSRDEAEDIVQDCFIKIWQNPTLFKSEKAKFTTWFYRVVNNACMDRNRLAVNKQTETLDNDIADHDGNMESEIDSDRVLNSLQQSIANLPDRQRQALILCVYEEVSNKEAAAIMNIGIKALESLLMRAKANLRADTDLQQWIKDHDTE